jgi:flavin reductase (DIM6/NTAB) family NADH-FMN oxidoreductase RutF
MAENRNRKRPWNRVNLPVYSISSKDLDGNSNMHVITYATAVSMEPKRFICAVYHNTKTIANLEINPHFVLQILHEDQYRLVDLLGKKSGHQIDKISRLTKRQLLTEWNGFKILNNCLAVMEMKIIDQMNGGDHTCFLCDVVAYKNITDGEALTIEILRANNIVRM